MEYLIAVMSFGRPASMLDLSMKVAHYEYIY
jgi:hypothetical protein